MADPLMGHWRNAVIFMFALPLASARQNHTHRLRAQSLSVTMPSFLVQLGQQGPSCQCTFDDQCSCEGALKFMECVKNACSSDACQCLDEYGTNHFLQSCSQMADECAGTGLKCTQEKATCKDKGVAWDSKIEQAAVKESGPVEEEAAEVDPKKYVLHTKYKATVRQMRSHGHRMFAQGIIVTLMMLSVTIPLLSSSNALIVQNTWSIIDAVVVTFLAVAWFIVVHHSLDYFHLKGMEAIFVHMAVSVLFLLASAMISWNLRNNVVNVSIFKGIFGPMVMWCNAGFVETVQKQFNHSSWLVLLVLGGLAIYYAVLGLTFHYVVAGFATTKGYGDDTENHMAAGALACGVVLWCHMVISGSYQTLEGPHDSPTSFVRTMMLNGLGICFIALSFICLPVLSRVGRNLKEANVGSKNYWKRRLVEVGVDFVKTLPCFFTMMSLAHLILNHMGYMNGSVSARLVLALTSTAIGGLMIALCSYAPFLKRDTDRARELSGLLLGVGGFITSVAWSGLLDNSINMMVEGEGYAHPFVAKLGITGFVTAFVFPVYCLYLKPLIISKSS